MAKELIRELQNGIWKWYPFQENAQVLYLSDSLCLELEDEQQYDYIVAIHTFETTKEPYKLLHKCKKHLKSDGKLLLAVDNRLGLRYFCGDRDPFTGRNFDGVEDYRRVSSVDRDQLEGRVYDKVTVEQYLEKAGFVNRQCFSVFPSIDAPQLFYAQDYLPEEELSIRYFTHYTHPDTVFLEEAYLYDGLVKNNMFHQMANGYLFECALENIECATKNVKHITLSMDRGESAAMATIICNDEMVIKKALYSQGVNGLQSLKRNHEDLKSHGIAVVDGKLEADTYIMPYIKAEIGTKHLQNLLRRDKEAFIHEMDAFREVILHSSEQIEPALSEFEAKEQPEIANGVWLKKGYFDLVPLNAFYVDGEYLFFDQEFCIENYSANVIIVRMVDIVYGGHSDLAAILPREFFWKRYDMEDQVPYLRKKSNEFLYELRNQKQLKGFNNAHRINYEQVHSNRQRMNFSTDEYQKLFVNIFDDLERYKLVLFGSGNFAKKFLDLYGSRYQIEAILDNNEEKWGSQINGVSICSPTLLEESDATEYKVIICIKNYLGVLNQLRKAGIMNIGIYDTNIIYPAVKTNQQNQIQISNDTDKVQTIKKKYHTGYIAGVFDLYHIGHLNMFKRAKEQCEYLIVGVVSDEGVRKNKRTEPFIPFEERIEMVRSCKYVDEAVEIPFSFGGTRDAYRLYHFDVQFSGSDYVSDPSWLADKDFLRKHGADMVFFPYTEQTSSTKIKALIDKELGNRK